MATTTCRKFVAIATFLLVAASCYGGVSAQAPVSSPETPGTAASPGPAAGTDCFTALVGLSDCLTYVEDGSNLTKPDKGCCPELSNLVNTNPICLCQLLGNPNATSSIGVKIDLNRALKLPSVCKVETPPVSTCSAVGVPVSMPPSTPHSVPPTSSHGGMSPVLAPETRSPRHLRDLLQGLIASRLCSIGVKIDSNRALKLPSVCKVETPPVSTCSAVGVPVSLPPSDSISPSGQLAPTPVSASHIASPGGQPAASPTSGVAASSPSPNAASSIQVSVLPFIFGSATAFVSIFF
ncbi:hypothetical protein L6164_031403 [Bauhinia variegata]|uniref:Uncharacterized protein n=1 Tax=Bauhinia variegata TaxID=167791 RepID=A0ACB9LFM2_BAUVA|nr:hypothetical protein L6164_031403 [Bauhinia variegata]